MDNLPKAYHLAVATIGFALALAASEASAITFGTPTANCGINTNCAFVNPAGSTHVNGIGVTYSPANSDLSNFTNFGTFDNAGRVFTGGLFDNAGFTNGSAANFNNNGVASRLELLHGTNAGSISNAGTVKLNFIELGGVGGSSNSELAGLANSGTIGNEGNLFNYGHLDNSQAISNKNSGRLVSHYNQFTFANGTPSLRYDVEINNQSGAAITNIDSEIMNGNQADANLSTPVHSSTIVNHGTIENIRGEITNFDTIKNFATFENLTAFITNRGVFENLSDSASAGVLSLERGGMDNFGTLRNNATISLIQDVTFTNGGRLENNGTLETDLQGIIVNGSEILDAGVIVNRGQFFNEIGFPVPNVFGSVSVSGLFRNIGGEVRNKHRFFVANGGTLTTSGHFENTAGSDVVVEGGTFNVDPGSGIFGGQGVTNNGTFTISSGALRNSGTFDNQSLGVVSVLERFTNTNVMTNAGNVRVYQSGSLSGEISVFPGHTILAGKYIQTGGKTVVDGTLAQAEIHNQGGVMAGGGTLIGHYFDEGGILRPGDPVTLTIVGDMTFTSGLLDIKIAGLDDFDKVVVTGLAEFLGGSIQLDFINGFAPSQGDLFGFLLAHEFSLDPSLVNIFITGLADGFQFTTQFTNGQFQLTALNNGVSAAPVPLPGTVILLASAMIGLGATSRRAKRH